jgi:hypothetical protein
MARLVIDREKFIKRQERIELFDPFFTQKENVSMELLSWKN